MLVLLLGSCGSSKKVVSRGAGQGGKAPLYIIHTNDTHCFLDKKLSFAHAAALKKQYQREGKNVLLLDDGDFMQGSVYGAVDSARTIIKIMETAGIDAVSMGNHEVDYGMQRFQEAVEKTQFPILACNFWNIDGKGNKLSRGTKPYKFFSFSDYTVAVIGVATPETLSKGNPTFFKDAGGNYKYSFCSGNDGRDLYDEVQATVDEVRAKGADYVIALTHLGVDPTSGNWASYRVAANTKGIDAIIDGHSHTVIAMNTTDKTNFPQFTKVPNILGDSISITQTGCYFAHIGITELKGRGGVTSTLLDTCEVVDTAVARIESTLKANVEKLLSKKVAETKIKFVINDEAGNRQVRLRTTNAGCLMADAYYYYANYVSGTGCDIAFATGGSVRADIPAGTWTYKDCKNIAPFGNLLAVVEVSGQTVLDMLEWGARAVPRVQVGGFIQPAALTFDIDTTVASTVKINDKGEWAAPPTGKYRVHNVKVYNPQTATFENLDLQKIYRVCSANYTVISGGDGMTMLAADKNYKIIANGQDDYYLAVAKYLEKFKDSDGNGMPDITSDNSPLKKLKGYPINYETQFDLGRINFVK